MKTVFEAEGYLLVHSPMMAEVGCSRYTASFMLDKRIRYVWKRLDLG